MINWLKIIYNKFNEIIKFVDSWNDKCSKVTVVPLIKEAVEEGADVSFIIKTTKNLKEK